MEDERQLAQSFRRETAKQQWQNYLDQLKQTEHKTNTPIKHAMNKLLSCSNICNNDQRIFKHVLLPDFRDILLIQKLKNRWVCSEEILKAIDCNEHRRDELYH